MIFFLVSAIAAVYKILFISRTTSFHYQNTINLFSRKSNITKIMLVPSDSIQNIIWRSVYLYTKSIDWAVCETKLTFLLIIESPCPIFRKTPNDKPCPIYMMLLLSVSIQGTL